MATTRRPDPEPMETDDVAIVMLGTVLWGLALVVILILGDRLDERVRDSWVWVAAAGVFLGLVGIRQVRRRRAARRGTTVAH